MIFQLLPSTFEEDGTVSKRHHLTSYVVDDVVAFDAGSLAMGCSRKQRENVRDVVLTHAHLDHTAGLPLFIDDLFAQLKQPIRIHAEEAVIEILERDVFNWSVYPRFSELTNDHGPVVEYLPFEKGREFAVAHLRVTPLNVNHNVPSSGFVISDGKTVVAMTGDTAELDGFWQVVNELPNLSALLIECAFPDELRSLAEISRHLTPAVLETELKKFENKDCPVYVINIKPMYRERTIEEIGRIGIPNILILEPGTRYDW